MSRFKESETGGEGVNDHVTLLGLISELDASDEHEDATIPESEMTEAQRRALSVLNRSATTVSAEDSLDSVATITLAEIEEWLRQAPQEAVLARGSMSVPLINKVVGNVADYGYAPEAEIEGDIDSEAGTAEITVVLYAVREDPVPVRVVLTLADQSTRTASVDEFGLAMFPDVPLKPFTVHVVPRQER
ncbi:hypothetical protein [Actinoplanes xinjiangensis]|uniref:Uncharacterized protein n=1 Tax=Actinoplanes xinjiangensis TaxID=512350 RepID=A0A316F6C8_9ACTN|nr:hypothetical protein [Actinoplanes xinjiangensis]PWK39469.1 hypothetical protein BC793_12241 [Actinoplanes xinjiangensis]GIF42667.1 hypothetical protein Axi01nite_69780 [Actinoplanes xinjiangensis]